VFGTVCHLNPSVDEMGPRCRLDVDEMGQSAKGVDKMGINLVQG